MDNFNWAIKKLRNRRKVRRPCWQDGSYWYMDPDEVIKWADGRNAHVHLNQIEAKDWELYKETKGDLRKKLANFINFEVGWFLPYYDYMTEKEARENPNIVGRIFGCDVIKHI